MLGKKPSGSKPIRVKRFANGSYAISAIDRERGQFTLVEGSVARARIVQVDGKRWKESLAGSALVSSGLASRAVAFAGTDQTLTGRSVTDYPSGTSREDALQISGAKVQRSTSWAFRDGSSARSVWETARVGELVRTDRAGKVREILRTVADSSGRTLTTSAFDGDMNPMGQTRSQFLPGGMFMSNTEDSSGDIVTSGTVVLHEGSTTGVIQTEGHKDGTIHQTVNGSDGAGSSYSSDMTVSPDGSFSGSSEGSFPGIEGFTVTVRQSGQNDPATGSASGFMTVEGRNNATGATVSDTGGVNSAGEDFQTAGASDGQGNESQTTVTNHADGGFSITTISKDSDGNVTIDSQDFDKDGNPVTPGGGDQGGGSGGDQGGGGGGGDQGGGGGGGDEGGGGGGDEGGGGGGDEGGGGGDEGGGGGQGSEPSDDGTDEGPPRINFGKSSSMFGDEFGGPFSVVRGSVGGGGDDGDGQGIDPRMSGMRGALVADVDEGGDGGGDPNGGSGIALSDTLRRPAGIVPTDDWGDTNNPRVLVATVALIAGARAGAMAQKALQEM
jgi:hypothetical protein